MKKILLFSCFIILSYSCAQNKLVNNQNELKSNKLIAIIKNDNYVFKTDLEILKNRLIQNISTEKKINFDKIEIIKQFTIGDEPKEFYYILLKDSNTNIKIARWLNKIDNKLYFNNLIGKINQFEQTYQFCVGKNDCNPEVFEIDKDFFWSCSKDPKCLLEPIKQSDLTCKTFKTIIISELEE
ncbi:hypothetical protein [Flavobacterium sp.]|jgi:hypothetical protein|uniref:hypothetical protein n=1 Tax=Flavobacterium sp. TaxID=239 RepID=UPI00375316DC